MDTAVPAVHQHRGRSEDSSGPRRRAAGLGGDGIRLSLASDGSGGTRPEMQAPPTSARIAPAGM